MQCQHWSDYKSKSRCCIDLCARGVLDRTGGNGSWVADQYRKWINPGGLQMKVIALILALFATPALAAPAITINGSSGNVTLYSGSMMSIAITGGPANPKDWVGVYSGSNIAAWKYLATDTTVIPTSGVASNTVHMIAPAVGSYGVRFLANPGNTVLASASIIVIAPPTAVWTGQGATWLPKLDLAGLPFFTFPQSATVRSITCRVEVPVGAPATFYVVKASDGQKISDGTQISAICDGNTAVLSTKQDLTQANPVAINPGDTIGFVTSSASWGTGNGMGSVTVGYTVP